MTAEPAAPEVEADLEFTTSRKTRVQMVSLDGRPMAAHRPKTQWFLDQSVKLAGLDEEDPAAVALVDATVERIFQDPDDRAWLYGRLRDEGDDFDYEDLTAILQSLRSLWGGDRPTGPSTGSSTKQQRRGGRSTARRR